VYVTLPVTKDRALLLMLKLELQCLSTGNEERSECIQDLKSFLASLQTECSSVLTQVVYA